MTNTRQAYLVSFDGSPVKIFISMEDAEFFRRTEEKLCTGLWTVDAMPIERRGYLRRSTTETDRG